MPVSKNKAKRNDEKIEKRKQVDDVSINMAAMNHTMVGGVCSKEWRKQRVGE